MGPPTLEAGVQSPRERFSGIVHQPRSRRTPSRMYIFWFLDDQSHWLKKVTWNALMCHLAHGTTGIVAVNIPIWTMQSSAERKVDLIVLRDSRILEK